MKTELKEIILDGFTEDNADKQIDRINELFEENEIAIEGKTYGAIWEFAKNYLASLN